MVYHISLVDRLINIFKDGAIYRIQVGFDSKRPIFTSISSASVSKHKYTFVMLVSHISDFGCRWTHEYEIFKFGTN